MPTPTTQIPSLVGHMPPPIPSPDGSKAFISSQTPNPSHTSLSTFHTIPYLKFIIIIIIIIFYVYSFYD
ncbi:hypothetical protein L6452_03837 [Arctium lappa]|uniref:Uncharacterized protein n=1 Tax=Arctium lappa TaxID=4217 RepID=A0ACB9FPZ5_ARCLA|nr:hypothetical protein L6452_03837 [Arctium lappa]